MNTHKYGTGRGCASFGYSGWKSDVRVKTGCSLDREVLDAEVIDREIVKMSLCNWKRAELHEGHRQSASLPELLG